MRMAFGVATFSGMLGVTAFGIFFTPVFYVCIRWLSERPVAPAAAEGPNAAAAYMAPVAGDGKHTTTAAAIQKAEHDKR
jgi:multidrug efflux pump